MLLEHRLLPGALLLACACACSTEPPPPVPKAAPEEAASGRPLAGQQQALVKDAPTPPPAQEPPPEVVVTPESLAEPVLLFESEREPRWVEAKDATAAGYTVVDLSNRWTPRLFAVHRGAEGEVLPNRYRRVFLGLSNDELNSDQVELSEGEHNYLELYGISPTLGVLRKRLQQSREEGCLNDARRDALLAVSSVPFRTERRLARGYRRLRELKKKLDAALAKAQLSDLGELAAKRPKLAQDIAAYENLSKRKNAFTAAEERLACEGLLELRKPGGKRSRRSHKPGFYDEALRVALRAFQQKHMIYNAHTLRPQTLAALARPRLENDHKALLRVLRERVVSAAGVIEDGSVTPKDSPAPSYVAENGEVAFVRNLAEEYADALAKRLGVDTPEGALEFFDSHSAEAFDTLRVAVELPSRPEYYGPHMDLSLEVDRGDVWYDAPFDEDENYQVRRREKYPTVTLRTRYREQDIPLVRWRTTIGGWRLEQAPNGYEYYKYKASDVGPRVMRKIISGPVWVAPESTPVRSLVKSRTVNGRWQTMVNYDELGPGHLSAYGVVAGYLVIPGEGEKPDVDRGIRIHGSSNYLSIYSRSGYSHGCHRLPNHLAVRLYDFLLAHRRTVVHGDAGMDFWRQFLWRERVYEMRIPSRGFVFELDPPLPVEVLEGAIVGELEEPVEGYLEKPGVRYPLEPTAASDAGAPEVDGMTGPTWRTKAPKAGAWQ